MDFLQSIANTFLTGVMVVNALFGGAPPAPVPTFGDFNPTGGTTYRLASSIGTTDTSIRLSSFKEPVSNIPYTMSYINTDIAYGTLDPNVPSKSEFISFTGITQNANGTAVLTGVTRGLARSPGADATGCTTASSTLRQSHSGQSIFILSDSPCFFGEYAVKENDESITGSWSFPSPTIGANPATKAYVDGSVFGGIGNASETATGTVEIATQAEAAASTENGSLGRLALPSSMSTSTWNSATAALRVIMSGSNGNIDQGFLPATTTKVFEFATTTYIGDIQAWQIGKQMQVITTTGTSTFTVPSGITRVKVRVVGAGGGGGGNTTATQSGGGGGAGGYAEEMVNVSGTTTIQVFVGTGGAGGAGTGADGANGMWSTFGTNGEFLSASGGSGGATGGPGGAGGVGSNGDLNTRGGGGGAGSDASSAGGSSVFGAGARSSTNTDVTGASGENYGGGGAGGFSAGADTAGGAGGQGVVIVEW